MDKSQMELEARVRNDMQINLLMYNQGIISYKKIVKSADFYDSLGVDTQEYRSLFSLYKPEGCNDE